MQSNVTSYISSPAEPSGGRESSPSIHGSVGEQQVVDSYETGPSLSARIDTVAKQNAAAAAMSVPDSTIPSKPSTRIKYDATKYSSWSATQASDASPSRHNRKWRTTWIRFGPVSGIFCMCLTLASLVASLGILAGSNNQATDNWSAPPSTYIAIFTAITNQSVRYAAIQGVIIAWWFRASKGSTLSRLHWDWRSGTTLRGALTAGRHMGLLGLACIFSTVVVIDGPLLQRASTVRSAEIRGQTLPLSISMAPELPAGMGGVWLTSSEYGSPEHFSPLYNDTIRTPGGTAPNDIWPFQGGAGASTVKGRFEHEAHLRDVVHGCPGKCRAKFQAPALFATSCATEIIPLHVDDPLDLNPILNHRWSAPLDHVVFAIDITLIVKGEHEVINFATGVATEHSCHEGTLNLTTCTLESGIGEYELEIENNEISLQSLDFPKFITLADNAVVNRTIDENLQGHPSTLSNIVNALCGKWDVVLRWFPVPGAEYGGDYIGEGPSDWYIKPGGCPSFSDPREDVLRDLNRFMLYSGAWAASDLGSAAATRDGYVLEEKLDPNVKLRTTVSGDVLGSHSVFHTDYWFFLGAAILVVTCIILILPTYWGWWRLGRPMSFSPLELAKAFESPLLEDCNSNSSGRDIANLKRDYDVKYGVVSADEGYKKIKLAFGQPSSVTLPQKNMRFDF